MPFYIYERRDLTCGRRNFSRICKTSGIPRAIQNHVQLLIAGGSNYPFGWHLPASGLLKSLCRNAEAHSIIIDLKPNVDRNISLYELTDLWGFSTGPSFTPLGVALRSIFVDHLRDDHVEFKLTFDDTDCPRDLVREFLYLTRGRGDRWNWGQAGRVNGALLWDDAWNFLIRAMGTPSAF